MALLDCVEIPQCGKGENCHRLFGAAEDVACYTNFQKGLFAYLGVFLIPFPFVTERLRQYMSMARAARNRVKSQLKQARQHNGGANVGDDGAGQVGNGGQSCAHHTQAALQAAIEQDVVRHLGRDSWQRVEQQMLKLLGGRAQGPGQELADARAEASLSSPTRDTSVTLAGETDEASGGLEGEAARMCLRVCGDRFQRAYLSIFEKPFKKEYRYWQSVTMFRR